MGQWIEKNANWYEGILDDAPSTNNVIEGHNSVVKKKYTLRKLLSFTKFNTCMFQISMDYSRDYMNGIKIYKNKPDIATEMWKHEVEWAMDDTNIPAKMFDDAGTMIFYVRSTNSKTDSSRMVTRKEILQYERRSWESLDEFLMSAFALYRIQISKEDLLFESKCTCPFFLKNYTCKHIIGIGLKYNILRAPDEANPAKFGKFSKQYAKKALIKQ